MPPNSDPRDPPDDRPTDQLPALISATSVAFTAPLPDGNLIPALIADTRRRRRLALRRILHRQHPQPEHAPRLCPGVRAVLRLVRAARPDAAGDPAVRRRRLYRGRCSRQHSAPGVKQQLAAVRMLFDWLVTGQVLPTNPAAAVRGPKHVVKTGKTPVLEGAEWRKLLESIPTDDACAICATAR